MQKEISIKIKPYEALNNSAIHQYLAILLGKNENNITGFYKLKQSIDARSRQQVWIT